MRTCKVKTASSFILMGMFCATTVASATVISVNPDGSYSTKEVKDYRQKQGETVAVEGVSGILDESARKEDGGEDFKLSNLETLKVEIFEPLEAPLPADLTKLDVELFTQDPVIATILKPKDTFKTFIATEAAKYEAIDEALIEAVIEAESNFDVAAVSPKGAMGLMQLMPATANRHKVTDVFNAHENIRGGTAELAHLMKVYNNPALALAAYNAGEGAVSQYGGVPPYRETQEYVVKVLTKAYAKRAKEIEALKLQKKALTTLEESVSKDIGSAVMVYSN